MMRCPLESEGIWTAKKGGEDNLVRLWLVGPRGEHDRLDPDTTSIAAYLASIA